jgi:excisionase family DNA binding protein
MSTQPIPQREPFVDAIQAAEYLDCSDKHVMRLAREGKLPAHPIGEGRQRRHWRFKLSELDAWMLARQNQSFRSCPGQETIS